jgi:hypothetical protein
MSAQLTTPTLDNQALQAKITEMANKGAMKAIEEYYTGYDSPFLKAFKEEVKEKSISISFDIPDIVSSINKAISDEVDKLTAIAISKTFIPQLNHVLHREEKEIKLSDILRKFVSIYSADEQHEFSFLMIRHYEYEWYTVEIASSKEKYKFTLHKDWKSKGESIQKYKLISLPNDSYQSKMMKINVGEANIEIPFTYNILNDQFYSYIARLILSDSVIELDCDDFEDEMFESGCHCH